MSENTGEESKYHTISYEKARKARRSLLLLEYEHDEKGKTKSDTGRLLHLNSTPREIGQHSVGLGIYFTTLYLFGILLVCLCVNGFILTILNITANNFAKELCIRTVNGTSTSFTTCELPFETSTWITRTTFGSYCCELSYNNILYCPTLFEINVSDDNQDIQNVVINNTCEPQRLSQRPNSMRLIKSDDELGEKCDGIRPKDVPLAYLTFILVGQIIMLLWIIYFKREETTTAEQIQEATSTAADYSVIISGFDPNKTTKEDIINYARHYGEVISAVQMIGVGKVIEQIIKLDVEKLKYQEILVNESNPKKIKWYWKPFDWLYFWYICDLRPKYIARDYKFNKIKEIEKKLIEYANERIEYNRIAIITFNYESHAMNILIDHQKPFLYWICDALSFRQLKLSLAPTLKGKRVNIYRAPYPTDIWWENTSITIKDEVFRRIISFIVTLIVITLASYVQYGLTYLAQVQRNKTMIESKQCEEGSVVVNNVVADTSTGSYFVNASIGIVVVGLNVLITFVVTLLSKYEKWKTRSEYEKWLVLKLSIFYFINSFVIPNIIYKRCEEFWYVKNGAVEIAFYIQLANALLQPVIAFYKSFHFFQYFMSKSARAQEMLHLLWEPAHFHFAERYASNFRTISLAFGYMPILPVSAFIGLIGIVLSYISDKYIALRCTQNPPSLSKEVTKMTNLVILCLPFIQIVFIRFFYFKRRISRASNAVINLSFILWIIVVIYYSYLSYKERFSKPVSKNRPFLDTIAKGIKPIGLTKLQSFKDAASPDTTYGGFKLRHEFYQPLWPESCPKSYKEKMNDNFKLGSKAYPANEELMRYQLAQTSGVATGQPSINSSEHQSHDHTSEITLKPLGPTSNNNLIDIFNFKDDSISWLYCDNIQTNDVETGQKSHLRPIDEGSSSHATSIHSEHDTLTRRKLDKEIFRRLTTFEKDIDEVLQNIGKKDTTNDT